MQQYNVTGMSCAACSSRVEKAVNGVPGVTSCAVSLLTNSMGVEGTASSADIIRAVEKAGYGASLKGAAKNDPRSGAAASGEDALKDTETPVLRKRLLRRRKRDCPCRNSPSACAPVINCGAIRVWRRRTAH